jgi:hypothetical protein
MTWYTLSRTFSPAAPNRAYARRGLLPVVHCHGSMPITVWTWLKSSLNRSRLQGRPQELSLFLSGVSCGRQMSTSAPANHYGRTDVEICRAHNALYVWAVKVPVCPKGPNDLPTGHHVVIPAKPGIQLTGRMTLDSCLRRNDDTVLS